MSGMIEVAKATVTVIPNMQGAQQAITAQLGTAAASAGTSASALAGTAFMGGLGTKLSGLTGLMTKALPVAAVAGVGKALFDIGEEFDEMTDTIIVGTGASGKALEELQAAAEGIATTVPVSFGEAGDLVQDLNTRLGLTGDTLQEVGTQIAQVGDLTGEAFDTEAFAGAMSAWGTAAEDMSGQLDNLFAISQSTGIGMNDLVGIMESAAPQMQALGYSFEDTAAMAGLLDKAGLDAGSTMTKMSKALTTLAKDGEEPADAMKRVTEEISNYIEKGDTAAAISAASDLFGTRGATQFVAAVQSGSMSIEEFSAAMQDSAGIISETENRTMDFGERVDILKNQFKTLLEPIGSAVFAGLSTIMAGVTTAFNAFINGPGKIIGSLFSSLVDLWKQIGTAMADAFGSSAGLDSFGSSAEKIFGVISKVLTVLKPLASLFLRLAGSILKPLATVVGSVLGAAFRTLMAVINKAVTVFNKLKSIMNTVKSAFNTFKNAVTKPFKFLGGLKKPHINISGGSVPFGIGGKGKKPSISVTWAARGGVLDTSTLIGIGAGEAGKEALLPLERNTEWADIIADKVNGGNTFNVTLNATSDESPEEYAQRFARELRRQVRMGAV